MWICNPLLQFSVIGQQHQPLAVVGQPALRIDILRCPDVGQRAPSLDVDELAEHVEGLIESYQHAFLESDLDVGGLGGPRGELYALAMRSLLAPKPRSAPSATKSHNSHHPVCFASTPPPIRKEGRFLTSKK